MNFNVNFCSSLPQTTYIETNRPFATLPEYIYEIEKCFPPLTLGANERVSLGIKVLDKYGEAQFPFYQRVYRLTLEEHQLIFEQAKGYAKDVVIWEDLDETTCKKDVDAVRSHYPKAIFSLLTIKKENWRSMPIVEIEGKHYYFYSEAYKGPIVDASYIEKYQACMELEKRPDFKVLKQDDNTVFLMEFMGDITPDFRRPSDIKLLVELIKCRSLNKKGLDMLPCRMAIKDGQIYCVDQKLCYCTFSTEFEAFQENIKWLKGLISDHGYAEEEELLSVLGKEALSYLVLIFEKSIKNISFGFDIKNNIPTDSLDHDSKVALAAASLRTLGTKEIFLRCAGLQAFCG